MVRKSAETAQEPLNPGTPTAGELEKINAQAYGELTAEDVYTFTLVLCDNEVDRDLERFSVPALEKLAGMFTGRSGIFDHSMSGRDQVARIYECFTVRDPARTTRAGEPYTALKARAYTLRGSALAREIEAGIKREVSVGCAVARSVCSVCGADLRSAPCSHERGSVYDGVLCCAVLEDPTDAYEWSFVAVPAQPAAGVAKSFDISEGEEMEEMTEILKSARGDVTVSGDQARALAKRVAGMESLARDGELYRRNLCAEIGSLCAAISPQSDLEKLEVILRKMTADELGELRKIFAARVDHMHPPAPQIAGRGAAESRTDNSEFRM